MKENEREKYYQFNYNCWYHLCERWFPPRYLGIYLFLVGSKPRIKHDDVAHQQVMTDSRKRTHM